MPGGDIPDPININERIADDEKLSLRIPFNHAVNDFMREYSGYGQKGWMARFPSEANVDWGYIGDDNDIMPTLETGPKVGVPFVHMKLEGIIQFTDIAEGSDLPDSKGIEAYMGLAAARAFLVYAREYRTAEEKVVDSKGKEKLMRSSVFNEELLDGFDARASLHNSVENSRFIDTTFDGLSLHLMSDATVVNTQTYRALFGLMYRSNDTKYLEMLTAFDKHFFEEIVDQDSHRNKMAAFVSSGQIEKKVYDRWVVDSFTDVWFAATHPFDEEEIEALLG